MMTSNVFLYKSAGFDPMKDFAPITNAGANIIVLAINADMPIKSVPELIAYAKANPGKLNYGSSGTASPHHLSGELLRQMTGIDITHVPYKGGGAALNDLLGGHIPMTFSSMSSAVPALPTGKLRILAVVEKSRYAGRIRNVVVARVLRAGGNPATHRRAAQHGNHQNHQYRRHQGETRGARICRHRQYAVGAGGDDQSRVGAAQRAHQGGWRSAGMTVQTNNFARQISGKKYA
jgi:hypothetical protein